MIINFDNLSDILEIDISDIKFDSESIARSLGLPIENKVIKSSLEKSGNLNMQSLNKISKYLVKANSSYVGNIKSIKTQHISLVKNKNILSCLDSLDSYNKIVIYQQVPTRIESVCNYYNTISFSPAKISDIKKIISYLKLQAFA